MTAYTSARPVQGAIGDDATESLRTRRDKQIVSGWVLSAEGECQLYCRFGEALLQGEGELGHVDGGDTGWSAEQDLRRGDLSPGRERECLGVSADLRRVVVDLGLDVCR